MVKRKSKTGKLLPKLTQQNLSNKLEKAVQTHRSGDLIGAEKVYKKILSKHPSHPDVIHMLGLIAHQRGKNQIAKTFILKAIDLQPGYPEAFNNLGNVLRELEQINDALNSFCKAIELRPNYAEAHNNLGLLSALEGNLEYAVQCFQTAIRHAPHYAKAHSNLGSTLRQLGELIEAENSLRHAITLDPNDASTYNRLGLVLKDHGQLFPAQDCYKIAISKSPKYVDPLINLGNLLMEMDKGTEAETTLRLATTIKPDSAIAHNNLGLSLRKTGKIEEAIDEFKVAISLNPKSTIAHHHLGLALGEKGNFVEAIKSYRRALEIEPNMARAYESLATLKTFDLGDEDITGMHRALEMAKTDDDRIYLNFSLGKAHDDTAAYDVAFHHYKRANQLKRSNIRYNSDENRETTKRYCTIFDQRLFTRFQNNGHPTHIPIFIVGMPRSGTTLVEQILASHPQVHGGGELALLRDITTAIPERITSNKTLPDCITDMQCEEWRALGGEYFSRAEKLAQKGYRITDKMPANFWRLGLIHLMLPNARIIHCRRNPIDTCLSCFTTNFSAGQSFSYDLVELGKYYVQYDILMKHWKTMLPGRFIDVDYEDIIMDLPVQTQKLLDHCGLDWDDRCLEFYSDSRVVTTASLAQVRRPIYGNSVDRWLRYETQLAPLLQVLGRLVT